MSWKTTEPPLNLIHILPSERKKSKSRSPNDRSLHLRIQVGDEPPSVGMEFCARSVSMVREKLKRVGQKVRSALTLCQGGLTRTVRGVVSSVVGVLGFGKKIAIGCVNLVVGLATRAKEMSLQLWGWLTKKRKKSKRAVDVLPTSIDRQAVVSSKFERPVKLERDELLLEVHALRDQLTGQRSELTRVNAQIGELKALALSQQQVLLHLGKEIESIESKTVRPEKTPSKKTKTRSARTSKSKPVPSSTPPSTAQKALRSMTERHREESISKVVDSRLEDRHSPAQPATKPSSTESSIRLDPRP